jgi:acyl-CoA reductase-like NAD-dependent aldehyde dehydrogenase
MAAAAKHLTPVALELGGRNPVLIEEDTNLEVAANRVVTNKWVNCGQVCLSPDYVLINKSLVDTFVRHLKLAIEKQFGSHPKQSDNYSRIINEKHFQ